MASPKSSCSAHFFFSVAILIFLSISSLHVRPAAASEFKVGDAEGWEVPSDKSSFYNSWASKNRFQVGDSLLFEFKKESVMMVSSKEEYKNCSSSKPLLFANSSPKSVMLEHPGLFYFVSGVAEHCDRGLKMIVKVLGNSPSLGDYASPPFIPHPGPADDVDNSAAAAATHPITRIAFAVIIQLFMLLFGCSLP